MPSAAGCLSGPVPALTVAGAAAAEGADPPPGEPAAPVESVTRRPPAVNWQPS
jgi:hypothetical protein